MKAMQTTDQPTSHTSCPRYIVRVGAFAALVAAGFLSGCTDTPTGNVLFNQADGMVINPPEFLQGRAIVQANLAARVTVVADGVSYEVDQTSATSSPWVGQVYVPEGSNPTISVTWVETQVAGLQPAFNGELPLAIYSETLDTVEVNEAFEILTEQYITQSTAANPLPQLDVDADGASNIVEREAGSRPGDAQDLPSTVLVLYNEQSPVIDGEYESLWNTAQFRDQEVEQLAINQLLLDTGVINTSLDYGFRWAAMHDGTYMYLMVFAELGANQTPTGDSGRLVYEDDSVDIYWDGNNSKGASYDGVDDFHVIVGLLDDEGLANRSVSDDARIQTGDRSAPIDLAAVQYASCICTGEQQIYEIRLDLVALKIPLDTTFGFELNINNDADGDARDAKWAWFNDTRLDDTWRFPLRMGNVRLEAIPR